jgi:hypothetical protein
MNEYGSNNIYHVLHGFYSYTEKGIPIKARISTKLRSLLIILWHYNLFLVLFNVHIRRNRHSDWLRAGWSRVVVRVPGALSPGVKRPGREADQSLPTSAEIKNPWIYTSTPLYVFMALCLVNLIQGQFYLYLTSAMCSMTFTLHTRWSKGISKRQ